MIIKYLKVGLLNTLLTLIIIFIAINILSINYNFSYFIGYAIGLINSFILNKYYTFNSSKSWQKEILPFLIVFIISYTISHITLFGLIEKLYIDKNMSIILSMIIYTLIGFTLNKKIFKG
ncbi:MAG: sugar translocase [Arcobacter sp.]|nr:MAG: sugar translocase [Arcobacter sp.]